MLALSNDGGPHLVRDRPRPERPAGEARLELRLARVVGSRCGDLGRAVAALAEGTVDPTPLVQARYPLARADEALAHAARRGTLKVLIEG